MDTLQEPLRDVGRRSRICEGLASWGNRVMPGSLERIASTSELLGVGPFALATSKHDVVVVRTQDGLRAYQGRCPHQGALLGEGDVERGALVCRNHGWRFDLA